MRDNGARLFILQVSILNLNLSETAKAQGVKIFAYWGWKEQEPSCVILL